MREVLMSVKFVFTSSATDCCRDIDTTPKHCKCDWQCANSTFEWEDAHDVELEIKEYQHQMHCILFLGQVSEASVLHEAASNLRLVRQKVKPMRFCAGKANGIYNKRNHAEYVCCGEVRSSRVAISMMQEKSNTRCAQKKDSNKDWQEVLIGELHSYNSAEVEPNVANQDESLAT
jgi:hypothetical protein